MTTQQVHRQKYTTTTGTVTFTTIKLHIYNIIYVTYISYHILKYFS